MAPSTIQNSAGEQIFPSKSETFCGETLGTACDQAPGLKGPSYMKC